MPSERDTKLKQPVYGARGGFLIAYRRVSENARIARLVGPRIYRYRTQAGLTQEQLGEKVGAHAVYISLLERGLRCVSMRMLFRLGDALGVDPAELVRRK